MTRDYQRAACAGECGYCGTRLYTAASYCCRECREADEQRESGAVTDDGSLAVRDDDSPADTDGQAAPTDGRTAGCERDSIGDDCRCEECEDRKRAQGERDAETWMDEAREREVK
jgi:hypothetical protein